MPRVGDPIDLERPVTWVAMVGFMGTGKSRIGAELARALALHFVDTDKLIEKTTGLTIPQIFDAFGEAEFRRVEAEAIDRAVKLDNFVISCGGGTFVNPENRAKLLARGPVVALWASPETIFERTRRNPRPLLQVPDPIGRITELLEGRRPAYSEAPIQMSTDGRRRSDVVQEIVERLWEWFDAHPDHPASARHDDGHDEDEGSET
jgi:shikimate kinase